MQPNASVTVIVSVLSVVSVDVPPKTPSVPNVMPVGKEPDVIAKLYGAAPPVVASDAL